MATLGPGKLSPNTCTLPSASRTRRVPSRMKRRSNLDKRRIGWYSAFASNLHSNEFERDHVKPGQRGAELPDGIRSPQESRATPPLASRRTRRLLPSSSCEISKKE